MEQMTVHKLFLELMDLVNKGQGDKKVVVADDNEGNGYHGIYYSVTSDPKAVKGNIDVSNGLYDSQETDPNKIVIIG